MVTTFDTETDGGVCDLNHNGVGMDRFGFVAEAVLKIAAGIRGSDTPESSVLTDTLVEIAFTDAEALWAELCKRFPDDSTEGETE